jgi:hypothetical protein
MTSCGHTPRGPPSSRNRSKNPPLFEVYPVPKWQFNLKKNVVDCCGALHGRTSCADFFVLLEDHHHFQHDCPDSRKLEGTLRGANKALRRPIRQGPEYWIWRHPAANELQQGRALSTRWHADTNVPIRRGRDSVVGCFQIEEKKLDRTTSIFA